MTLREESFTQPAGDGNPFVTAEPGPPISYGAPPFRQRRGVEQPPLNTFAVLASVFAVLAPPAGVAFGHLALPQIRRTGQRGWLAAVWGLALGYAMCVVLVVVLLWLFAGDSSNGAAADSQSRPAVGAPPSVVTSIAPPPHRPHTKLELDRATVGTCVEIEKRDQGGEALDLYQVPCQHRVGVYTVAGRESVAADCNSTYVATPADPTFAVCLNRY